jgi:hypothetical protein
MRDSIDNRPTCSVPGCDNITAENYGSKNPRYPRWRRSQWIHELHPETIGNEPFCCSSCHDKNTARKNGVKNVAQLTKKRTIQAKSMGFASIQEMDDYARMQKCIAYGFTELQYNEASTELRTAMSQGYSTVAEYSTALNQKLAEAAGYTRIADWKNSTHPYRYILNEIKTCENHDGRCGFKCNAPKFSFLPGQLQVDHIDGYHENNDRDNLQVLCSNCHDVKSGMYKDMLAWDKKPDEINEMVQQLLAFNRDVVANTAAQLSLF